MPSDLVVPGRYFIHIGITLCVLLVVLVTRQLPTGTNPGERVAGSSVPVASTLAGASPTPAPSAQPPTWHARPGRILLSAGELPAPGAEPAQQTPESGEPPESRSSEPVTYTVADGDTVSGIADRFGITAETIMLANGLWDPDSLQVGDELVILPVTGILHEVGEGDNLNSLALAYGVEAEEITEFNGISDPDALQVGDRLVVPNGRLQLAYASITSRGGRPEAVPVATGSFGWPSGGSISQYFGEGGHSGLDLATQYGNPIYAADTGVVVTALQLGTGYGWHLIIDHENGYQSLYSHMSSFNVDYGERVVKGQVIGAIGSTGLSTGPHLHFEVFEYGARVDPLDYLP